jgi:hypothetical protein
MIRSKHDLPIVHNPPRINLSSNGVSKMQFTGLKEYQLLFNFRWNRTLLDFAGTRIRIWIQFSCGCSLPMEDGQIGIGGSPMYCDHHRKRRKEFRAARQGLIALFWLFGHSPVWKLPDPAPKEEVYITPQGPLWKFDMGQGLNLTINPDGSNSIIVEPHNER